MVSMLHIEFICAESIVNALCSSNWVSGAGQYD